MTDLVQRLTQCGANHLELEAADRIEALERDVNAIHHAMKDAGWHPGRTDDRLTDIIKAKGAEMARLERENAELRKDAERYRWLRDPANMRHEDDLCVSDGYFNEYREGELDAAIDAAMKEQT
jgi:outer membrane murein-binding lipoprotein Lpp